jgi:NAD(P)-dependent dehydrogenase (short-subunit alcohol dehydrogenase family)
LSCPVLQVYKCDCSDWNDVRKAALGVKRDLGVPDVIINNAGEMSSSL